MAIETLHNATATAKGIENFAPKPRAQRSGIGLALSGGGYRAALFHLGALRRLNELGVLAKLRTISSVSGGSIMSAHLASRLPWPLSGVVSDWEERIAKPFRAFTSLNIRNAPGLKRWLLPWNWPRSGVQVETLASEYQSKLTKMNLVDLPQQPTFIYCATDLAFGVDWNFQRDRIGDYQAGYIRPTPPDWPVSKAVAASSCFPPIFDPLRMPFAPSQYKDGDAQGPEADAARAGIALSDGAVYDNLGLEPIWKDHAVVLSSDGGSVFDFAADKNFFGRVERYISIQGNQELALRKRWLISNFLAGVMEGTYWGIGSLTSNYGAKAPAGYSQDVVTLIAKIRTDLDRFSEGEKAVLENHGYLMAEAAAQQHLPDQVPKPSPALLVPHPEWMDESRAKAALQDSWKRKILGH
jgi:NTE family protein